jgi:hypothetical protein
VFRGFESLPRHRNVFTVAGSWRLSFIRGAAALISALSTSCACGASPSLAAFPITSVTRPLRCSVANHLQGRSLNPSCSPNNSCYYLRSHASTLLNLHLPIICRLILLDVGKSQVARGHCREGRPQFSQSAHSKNQPVRLQPAQGKAERPRPSRSGYRNVRMHIADATVSS